MKIKEILKAKGSQVWMIREDQSVRQALEALVKHHIGALLVQGAGEGIAGIISERDIIRGYHQKGAKEIDTPVRDLMTKDIIVVSPEDEVNQVMEIMTEKRIRHIPVVSEGARLEGIVSIGDVVKAAMQHTEHEIHYLKEYLYGGRPPDS